MPNNILLFPPGLFGGGGGGAGGDVTVQYTALVDPVFGNDATGTFGNLGLPYKTIQAAIDDVPNGTTPSDLRRVFVILISSGTYDEDLTILLNHKKIALLGLGPWNLGLFNGDAWSATNARNISISVTESNVETIRHSLSIGTVFPHGEAFTTHPCYNTRPRISGRIILTSPISTTSELILNCEIVGFGLANCLDSSGYAAGGIINVYWHQGRARNAVDGVGASKLHFRHIERCEFNALCTVASYSRIRDCTFDAGFSPGAFDAATVDDGGIFETDLKGTFTGPAGSFLLDHITNRKNVIAGGALAGGATKVTVEKGLRVFRSTAADGAILLTDDVVFGTGGAGGITLTLPSVSFSRGMTFTVMKVDAGVGAVTVSGGGPTINGVASVMLAAQYVFMNFYSDGTSWFVL